MEKIRGFFLYVLFISIPFSIAGDHFAVLGLYLCSAYFLIARKDRWENHPMTIGVVLLLLGAVVSSIYSDAPLTSFSYFRNFWRFGLPFAVFFAFKNRDSHKFIAVLALISGIVGIYATIQYFTGLDLFRSEHLRETYKALRYKNAVGLFSHHLTYGGVSLLLISVFIPQLLNKEFSWPRRGFFLLSIFCTLSGILFSLGRSVWIGTAAAIAVIFLLKIRLRGYLLLGLAIVIGVVSYNQIDDKSKKQFYRKTKLGRRINSFNLKSNKDRILMWTAGWQVIKDNPILGTGPNRSERVQPYYDRLAKKHKHKFQHEANVGVHNIYLQTWIDFGILGLIGLLLWWLILIGQILYVIKKHGNESKTDISHLIGICAGFIGIMIAGVFENNFRDGEVQVTIFTLMGLALALMSKIRGTQASDTR